MSNATSVGEPHIPSAREESADKADTHKEQADSLASQEPRLGPQSVLVIAQSISHLPPVSTQAANALAPDAEYRIRQIVQDALKFMNHSKRTRLNPNDINSALRLRNADPVYGYGPLSARAFYEQPPNRATSVTAAAARPQPKSPPNKTGKTGAAVAGRADAKSSVNPSPSASQPTTLQAVTAQSNAAAADASAAHDGAGVAKADPPPLVLSPAAAVVPDPPGFTNVINSRDLFFASHSEINLEESVRMPLPPIPLEVTVQAHWLAMDSVQPTVPQNPANKPDRDEPGMTEKSASSRRKSTERFPLALKKLPMKVKPRVKHVLSRELQLYFIYVNTAMLKYDPSSIERSMDSVSTEHGIVQLLPYLSLLAVTTTREHMLDLPLLFSVLRLVSAMNDNTAFQLDRYLHQLLPATVTSLVGKRLCANPSFDHWALRDYAAALLRRICNRYAAQYVDLLSRLTITFGEALNKLHRPLTTHYGVMVGCAMLGPLVVKELVLPRLPGFAAKVKAVLEAPGQNAVRRFEAAKVYCALAWAVSRKEDSKGMGVGESVGNGRVRKDGNDAGGNARPPCIRVDELRDYIPAADVWLPRLEKEYGSKVYPMGESVVDIDVANEILKLADDGNVHD